MPVGVRGLIMAALIAAIMSSLDSALNSAGTLVTLDFIKPLKPDLDEETYVKIGKIVTGHLHGDRRNLCAADRRI